MRLLFVAGCLFLASMGNILASDVVGGDKNFLKKFYQDGEFSNSDFSAYFLSQISPEKLRKASNDLRAVGGTFKSVTGKDGNFTILTTTHRIPITISRNDKGKIIGLRFQDPKRTNVSIQELLDELAGFPGKSSIQILRNGQEVLSLQPNTKMPVGSAFKIGILKALRDRIDSGRSQWSDVIVFKDKDRSLPSGRLQKWPDNSPITLHTLASLMISESDNTATDMLMDVVGRQSLARIVDIPVPLKTREFFILKANPLEAHAWRKGDTQMRLGQTKLLATLPKPPVAAVLVPFDPAIEWNMSTSKLCELMEQLGRDPIAAINPGLANRADWDFVTYKGGSEIGVLNLTTRLEKDNHRFCVSMTWNGDAETKLSRLNQLYTEILGQLNNLKP